MNSWTVYILICSDGKIYTGCTNDFGDRLETHNKGQVLFPRSRLPVTVLLTINFLREIQSLQIWKYL